MEEIEIIKQPLDTEVARFAITPEVYAQDLAELKAFVSGQLVQGLSHDYAEIPGCGKPSLLKPGAEKLLKLFGFKSRMTCTNSIIDYDKPLGLYEYKCQVGKYAPNGVFYTFAECEAICSTEEKKYKFKYNKEDEQRMDQLNTVKKMSQKRAFVGACVMACGASDYFTHDVEDNPDMVSGQNKQTPRDRDKMGGRKKAEFTAKDEANRKKLIERIMSFADGETEKATFILQEVTRFTNKEGKICGERSSFHDLTPGQLLPTLAKLNDTDLMNGLQDDWRLIQEEKAQFAKTPDDDGGDASAEYFEDDDGEPPF